MMQKLRFQTRDMLGATTILCINIASFLPIQKHVSLREIGRATSGAIGSYIAAAVMVWLFHRTALRTIGKVHVVLEASVSWSWLILSSALVLGVVLLSANLEIFLVERLYIWIYLVSLQATYLFIRNRVFLGENGVIYWGFFFFALKDVNVLVDQDSLPWKVSLSSPSYPKMKGGILARVSSDQQDSLLEYLREYDK